MPVRIQRCRTRGWRKPVGCIIVDRTTEFGNPFRVTGPAREISGPTCGSVEWWVETPGSVWRFPNRPEAIAGSIKLYRAWLDLPGQASLRARIPLLRGRDLACFCPAGQPCHADVLLELANQ